MNTRRDADAMKRREFLAGTAAAGMMVVGASVVRASRANSTLALGVIGCGGRGTWITNLFLKTGNYRCVACAD